MAPGSRQARLIEKRQFPVVGDGAGVWSFVHIADAADATVAALERGRRGVYNVVDDDPSPVSEWLPAAARMLGARRPFRIPRFVARMVVGEAGLAMMTQLRGASNARAKRELNWQPVHRSWRESLMADEPSPADVASQLSA
jgi:nucleoside-diphosphate-sugar epimerase